MMHTSYDRNNRRGDQLRTKREADAARRRAQRALPARPRRTPRLRNPIAGLRGWWYRRQLARSYHTRMLPVPGTRSRLTVIAITIALSVALGALLASFAGGAQRLQPVPLLVPASSPAASPQAQPSPAPPTQPAPIAAVPRRAPTSAPTALPSLSIDLGRDVPTMRVVDVGELGLLLRSAPNPNADPLKTLAEGSTVEVTGAAVEAGGVQWLPVRDEDGTEGWAATAYLAADAANQ
jgi:hypothetical protein